MSLCQRLTWVYFVIRGVIGRTDCESGQVWKEAAVAVRVRVSGVPYVFIIFSCKYKMKEYVYTPLFLKYRSQRFGDLIGQDVLVRILTNAVIKNRLGGALLFTGIRGTGKTSVARILARALNCLNRSETSAEPCCTCKICQDILADRHMDVIEIDAASHTSVDDVREIIESCKYKPVECKYKIYIIDEVHMLSKSAFNALLKTLEEPPSHVKFFFATTEIHKVPETVLSRCLKFDLKPIPANLLAQHLANILNLEGITADIEALNIIARASGNSARDSISILEQAISFCENGKVSVSAIKALLGHGDYNIAYEIIKHCLLGDTKNSINKFREYSKSGGIPTELINRMMELIHWLMCKKTATPPLDEDFIQNELKADLESNVLPKLSVAGLSRMWQAGLHAIEEIKLTSQPEYATEMILVRLCYLARLPELTEIINNLENNHVQPQPAQPEADCNPEETSAEPPQINDLDSLLKCLEDSREVILLNELKSCTAVTKFDRPNLILAQKGELSKQFDKRLEKTLSRLTNEQWHVKLSEDDKSLLSISEQDKIQQAEEISHIKNSEIIQVATELFPNAKLQITKEE